MDEEGVCPLCKKRKLLEEHRVKEISKDASGEWKIIMICKDCHSVHKNYVRYLKGKFGYNYPT